MRQLTLAPEQMAILTALVGAPLADHSPLVPAPVPEALGADDPDFVALREQHALEPDGATWRPNTMAGAMAFTCAQPEEVLVFRPIDPDAPGLSACRRGSMWVLCEVGPDGLLKMTVPFSRDLMISTVMTAFASGREEPTPTGFRFRGPAVDALAFSTLAGALGGGRDLTEPEALEALAHTRDDFARTVVVGAIGGGIGVQELEEASGRQAALHRLVSAGHLVGDGDRIRLAPAAAAAFAGPASAGVSVERWVTNQGSLAVTGFQAFRCGDRIVAFRFVPSGEPAEFEWVEVTRAEVRDLAAATYVPPERLAAPTAG